MKYQAIIFDCFGVIFSEVAPVWLRKHVSEEEFLKWKEQYFGPVDRGDMSEEEYFETLGKAFSMSAKVVRDEWLALAVPRPEMIALSIRLKEKYKLAVLSDTPAPFFREIISEHQLENLFDKLLISSELHMTKADSKIFTLAAHELGVSPAETIFIDDNQGNVERARSIGIMGLVFTDYHNLEKDLTALGIRKFD